MYKIDYENWKKEAKEFMDKNLSYDMTNYVYIKEIKEI